MFWWAFHQARVFAWKKRGKGGIVQMTRQQNRTFQRHLDDEFAKVTSTR